MVARPKSLVYLRPPRRADQSELLARAAASRALHRPWVKPPADAESFAAYLKRCARPDFSAHLVCRGEDDAIVGVFNLSQIFMGLFCSAYLSYYAFTPFAGSGYMTAGMRLVLQHAFGPLHLHRVEANLQPDNHASRALVQRCGFQQEGFSPRYLKIGGRWRDHERWALLAEDWRAQVGPRKSRDLP